MPRILLLPSGNTFSHLIECHSIGSKLHQYGHDIHYGISRHYVSWAKKNRLTHTVIPELWEKGPTDHPNVSWFIDRDYVHHCVLEEIRLIKRIKPDIIIANFKYTTGISARVTGARLVTMNILSMLPQYESNFGYLEEDHSNDAKRQRQHLNFFKEFCQTTLNDAAARVGQPPLAGMAEYLEGERCIVPDSAWFHRVKPTSIAPHHLQVDPLQCKRTPPELQASHAWKITGGLTTALQRSAGSPEEYIKAAPNLGKKRILLSLGSICRSHNTLWSLVSTLSKGPWQLLVSISSNNPQLLSRMQRNFPGVSFSSFFDMAQLASQKVHLHVCHGGLGSLFTSILHRIPVLVIPQQPEQDHNGMLAEHHGIGSRLWPSRPFRGQENHYITKLLDTPEKTILDAVHRLLEEPAITSHLDQAREALTREATQLPDPGQQMINLLKTITPPTDSKTIRLSEEAVL
ncbi:glycosyltransferase [Desulforhopalus singaporensis]|uniref:UDP:flavonoid glycosyltransferase YjiC, YdhE family n=1 Tax=Desulforhopalus singaporensis TaxID=91360 RepID=A0A1H0T4Y2_9BACT|nr:glycosyltransferase [Desulforhopalus singaporensis]SDP48618.1 UDP:flavonoid glycosyltransferase YjiC, YdhE family [Desulforhopalus singaporensis]